MLKTGITTFVAAAVLIAAAISGLAEPYPGSFDRRVLAAELIVSAVDAERLVAEDGLSERERAGLASRVRGAVAFLPILLRRGAENRHSNEVEDLRNALADNDWPKVVAVLRGLSALYPFDATGLAPPKDSEAAVKLGGEIHETYCAACHEGGENEDWPPSPNLFEFAKNAPEKAMLARFFNGIRGDASTAMAQPMSASDIAALIAYYRATPSPY